jgi:hypothetical protein
MAIAIDAGLQDFVNQKVQSPVALVMVQLPTSNGEYAASQIILPRPLQVTITRDLDPSADVAQVVFADDTADMFSSNPTGVYTPIFQPGLIDNKFIIYMGLEGCNYPNQSNFVPYNRELLQKFTGYLEVDENVQNSGLIAKTISLIDLTKQFRFPVNDSYPHPIYGNQTLQFFDPTYNLTPINPSGGTATQWQCDGRMFTLSSAGPVYGSTHIDPDVYIDTTGGGSPASAPLSKTGYTVNSTTSILTCSNYTFDYRNGYLTLTTAVPVGSVVSMAGNPTYMSPESMISRMVVGLASWSPNFLELDASNVLLPMFLGNGQSIWTCIQTIAAMTNPRFLPWQIWADENGFLRFFEQRVDGPPTETFLEGANCLTSDWTNSARNLRTVVRADATVTDPAGDQPVVSIAYDLNNINLYGQTETLEMATAVTQNASHFSISQAASYLNGLTTALLGQVSRPILTCQADLWPNPARQPGDKIYYKDPRVGMDRQFIITQMTEQVSQKQHTHSATLTEYYDTVNYMMGIPAGTAGDGLAQDSTTPPPAQAVIGSVRLGNGSGLAYPYSDGSQNVDDSNNAIYPIWYPSAGAMHFDYFLNTIPSVPVSGTGQTFGPYNYANLPPRYGWTASTNTAGTTVYYGTAPSGDLSSPPLTAGWTTYVGPDSVFYAFSHAPPFNATTDLTAYWTPPGNTKSPTFGGGYGYAGQATTAYTWAWWYLCLDSNLGTGKYNRPIQRINASQDGVGISVPSTGGVWKTNSWTSPPGPLNGSSYYYGQNVVGITDYYTTPTGFVGANVMGDGVHLGVAYGSTVPNGAYYKNYQKMTRGHYCLYAANNLGQTSFLRIPFFVAL